MKILYVITQGDGGGAQKYVQTLANYFNGNIASGSELRHLRRSINPYHDFLAIWEIRGLIKSVKPDIVHLNSSKAGVLGSFAAIGLKTKVIFTAHGFIFNEPMSHALRSFYIALEKVASSYRDFIITVSDADKKSALDLNLISSNKIATIYNGLPPISFLSRDEARASLKLPNDKILIGIVANFYKTKGLDVLIETVSMLSADDKNRCQFVLIGDGPERRNLELGIKNYNLENNIKLLGKINNAEKYLSAFDIFLLPSRKEGFPYSILEAMQAGLPIIATKVGGIPEALGEAGILVEPENPNALFETVTVLVHNEQKRKDLSQKSLERSKLFTETKMLEETQKIYEMLLKK